MSEVRAHYPILVSNPIQFAIFCSEKTQNIDKKNDKTNNVLVDYRVTSSFNTLKKGYNTPNKRVQYPEKGYKALKKGTRP